jgi:hypothetical protein
MAQMNFALKQYPEGNPSLSPQTNVVRKEYPERISLSPQANLIRKQYPEGISSLSPGLSQSDWDYPGFNRAMTTNPERVESLP